MKDGANRLIGDHDFRNFCKMDVVNVDTFTRTVNLFEISPAGPPSTTGQLFVMTIRGSAFLWHQVDFPPKFEF